MAERFFVTGALGCIGAWVVRNLVQAGVPTTVFDVASDPHRLRLIMTDAELAQVRFATGDITDLDALQRALADSGATHVIHLAALQVPFCKADPPLGARVNVVGTVNMFEAVKRLGLGRLVYASSVAVFGGSDDYPAAPLADDALPHPRNHYGVYKLANEGTARIYWQDDGVASLALRPYTVYGPGRDQGLTSGPTKAMLAAALGQPYHIPFGGRGAYQLADDAARVFIQAARAAFTGAEVYNLRGTIAHMRDIVAAIEMAAPDSRGRIAFDPQPLPLPEETDDTRLRGVLGDLPVTPLAEGVAATIAHFRAAVSGGRLQG
jgi:nucleoside-diphosphate-sugar epimerase